LSPRRKTPRTFDELVQLYYGRYKVLAQYKDFSDEELMQLARTKALQVQADAQVAERGRKADAEADLQEDEAFRQERMAEYERVYGEWDDAGDLALLINLVELEVQFRAIRRDLSRATLLNDKEKYWKALRENSEAQKSLQVTLGIDKKSRDAARSTGNPMDNWQEIKEEIGDWVDQLVDEFPEEANNAKDEQQLKDLMKYKLSWPFKVIDAVIDNLKRVNGIVENSSEGP
jgi:hypothetical protein